jgi:hypothetical protein
MRTVPEAAYLYLHQVVVGAGVEAEGEGEDFILSVLLYPVLTAQLMLHVQSNRNA